MAIVLGEALVVVEGEDLLVVDAVGDPLDVDEHLPRLVGHVLGVSARRLSPLVPRFVLHVHHVHDHHAVES